MAELMTPERIAEIKEHLAYAAEGGMTMGDIYARDLLAENVELRKALGREQRTATEAAKRIGELEQALVDPDELVRRAHEIRNADQQYEFELEGDLLASGGGER